VLPRISSLTLPINATLFPRQARPAIVFAAEPPETSSLFSILSRNYKVGTKTLRVFSMAALEELQK